MRFTSEEIAAVTGGVVVGASTSVSGVTIDSREVAGGDLFVPIVAERDGHDFVDHAIAARAAAYLTVRPPAGRHEAVTAIRVEDTLDALQALGRAARARITGEVVGVTGSVGKTSTKDLAAAVLATERRAHASHRSHNNEMGVPLTLANAADGTEAVVVEMGARGRDHIATLCELAAPTVGVVTAVGLAHTELFGTIEEIERAKGELVEALPRAGTAVLNLDDARVATMGHRTAAGVLGYGHVRPGQVPDLTAERVVYDDELRPRFTLCTPWGRADAALGIRGVHNVSNALAAAAVGLVCGVSLEGVVTGLASGVLSPHRMDLQRTRSGAIVLNDAYNANPMSMESALRSLAALPGRRRFAVLGVMAELGSAHRQAHAEIGDLAALLGIEVIAVGVSEYGGLLVHDADEALAALGELSEGDVVLLKGSRVAGLERLAPNLTRSSER